MSPRYPPPSVSYIPASNVSCIPTTSVSKCILYRYSHPAMFCSKHAITKSIFLTHYHMQPIYPLLWEALLPNTKCVLYTYLVIP